ncbi:MAG TPA: hypothetical protein VGB08_11460 [Allosphingosinicella sp.]|jgi:hypothetical protein
MAGSGAVDALTRAAELVADGRRRAAELAASSPPAPPFPTRESLTADHPLSRALGGVDRARDFVDPPPPAHVLEAEGKRSRILELSCQRRPVSEIARAVGLAYGTVVKARMRLRREGKLPSC